MNELPPPIWPAATTTSVDVDVSHPSVPPSWPPPRPTFAPPPDPHPTLPLSAGVGAIVVLTLSLLVSKVALDQLVDFEWPLLVYVALIGVVGYGPSMAWCVYVSRRSGTGRLFHDVGLRPQWSDLGWGPVIWLSAIAAQVAVGIVIVGLGVPVENNTDGIAELAANRTYVVSIVITAVAVAPFVEEIVFRGVVLRSLLSRFQVVPVIVLQALLFGAAHVDPVRGVGNIGLVVVLAGVGAVLGGAAYLLRRIGPTIVAHAILNGVVLTLVLTGVTERLTS